MGSSFGVIVHFAGEEAAAERAVGDEADAELFEQGEDFLLGLTPPEGVLGLEGGDGLGGVSAADGFGAGFRQAEVFDFAFGDEGLDGAGYVFDRDVGVYAVLVEEVDVVGLEAAEGALDGAALMSSGREETPEMPGLPCSSQAKPNLVARTILLRMAAKALPRRASLVKGP